MTIEFLILFIVFVSAGFFVFVVRSLRHNPGKQESELPETIVINSSELLRQVEKYKSNIVVNEAWKLPLGIFLSLLICLIASDFKDKFGIEAVYFESLILYGTIASSIWLFIAGIKSIYAFNPDATLIDGILKKYKNIFAYTAVFVIKQTKDNKIKVLVKRYWDCFFLPFEHYLPQKTVWEQTEVLKRLLASNLGVPENSIRFNYFENPLVSQKFSYTDNINKVYKFEFFYVYINGSDFDANTEQPSEYFTWMTLDEMEMDEKTRDRNRDVISHLKKHHSIFLGQLEDSIK